MRRIGLNCCPYCGSFDVYRSHPKTLLDRACGIFLLQLARCHDCLHRHYRPVFLDTLEEPGPIKKPTEASAEDQNRKRSA
jgi:hypothetical protein